MCKLKGKVTPLGVGACTSPAHAALFTFYTAYGKLYTCPEEMANFESRPADCPLLASHPEILGEWLRTHVVDASAWHPYITGKSFKSFIHFPDSLKKRRRRN